MQTKDLKIDSHSYLNLFKLVFMKFDNLSN